MKLTTVLLLVSSFSWATDYYVSPSGLDSNACTQHFSCREIAPLTKILQPGDNVLVADGSYNHFIVDTKIGLSTAPITIMALGDNAIVLPSTWTVPTASWRQQDTVIIWQSEWIVLEGLRTFNAPRAGFMVSHSNNVTIQNCKAGNNQKWGLFGSTLENISLFNNEFYGSIEQHGTYLSDGVLGGLIFNNYFHDNAGSGFQTNGEESSRITIANNRIERNGKMGGSALNLLSVVYAIDIHDNHIINNYNSGIAIAQGSFDRFPIDVKIHSNEIVMDVTGHTALTFSNIQGPLIVERNILTTPANAFNIKPENLPFLKSNNNAVTSQKIVAYPKYTSSQWQAIGQDLDSRFSQYYSQGSPSPAIAIPNYNEPGN